MSYYMCNIKCAMLWAAKPYNPRALSLSGGKQNVGIANLQFFAFVIGCDIYQVLSVL